MAARRKANRILAAVLIPLTLLTLAGMAMLWPSGSKEGISLANPYSAAPGVTFDTGTIQSVETDNCMQGVAQQGNGGQSQNQQGQQSQQGSECTFALTEPDKGGSPVNVVINPDVAKSHGVKPGDQIRYLNLSNAQGAGASQGSPAFIFVDFVRTLPIVLLALLYAAVVIAVARWRGLRALIGLVGAYFVLAGFMLPGLVEGKPPLLLALVGSTVIMIGVLYFAHGFSARTSTALLGTMFGLGITALLAAWATGAANLAGVGNHDATTLVNTSANISISGVILCGLIISGLGVLNDVTITQSSAVWELYELAPGSSARKLFTSAMRIGRDHIASTVYTIAFAYAGAALPILIIVMLYDRPLADTLTSAELSEEVIRTLVGSIGLVLAIPVTTLIAVLVVKATGVRAGLPAAPAAHEAEPSTGQLKQTDDGGTRLRAGASRPGGGGEEGNAVQEPGVEDTGSLAAAALARRSRPAGEERDGELPTRRGRRADRG
ncbi:YibE/F family protein [Pseudarthrobacter phenanthrenivorans]|uniref:YibE/F family protein n=3 Tax=Pseudarthrobacter phenanthrenivorans TaxID=361575 RepID=A0A3B0FT92_PSEPS|nr:YibE/F family protein [Pseudarthrobacter phenanthrenivorans]ADX72518.1 YibE/F-like protein [Pseudarthrobacter phenanthrenivorans Sphe3]RKO23060.1 YibE/F family protein [Pseudarthrobacter phenanthrenivorans]TPV51422.1 YibE/F family protein [Pseudarthrobacter phenanthrenivorans]